MAQTGNHKGLTFGIFLAPFHRVGENPTLGMARDMELIEWIDELGYDEAWIGEHHSAGWETIASPEVFIGAAIERTRYIRLGSGVTSLPYHHPLMVANRFVQLDHMSRGRTMLGCGPGALPSDAYMMGIEPSTQRPRMEESLAAIMALLKCEEPVTMKTDWFELQGGAAASRALQLPALPDRLRQHHHALGHDRRRQAWARRAVDRRRHAGRARRCWASSGASTRRPRPSTATRPTARKWRVVVNAHVAEDDEQALREVHAGERSETVTYFEDTLGRPPGRCRRSAARRREDGHDAGRHSRHRGQGHRAAARLLQRRLRRRPVPRPRMGEPRAARCAPTSCSRAT